LKRYNRQRGLTKEDDSEFKKLETLQISYQKRVKEDLTSLLSRILDAI